MDSISIFCVRTRFLAIPRTFASDGTQPPFDAEKQHGDARVTVPHTAGFQSEGGA